MKSIEGTIINYVLQNMQQICTTEYYAANKMSQKDLHDVIKRMQDVEK